MSTSPANADTTAEDNKVLFLLPVYLLASMMVCQFYFASLQALYIAALPMLYIYMVATCPGSYTFDAKKELKRVLSGADLPDDHPQKPRGLLGKALANVRGGLSTEIATAQGYDVTMWSLLGAALVACVHIPSANMKLYWVGAFQRWFYVTAVDLQQGTGSKSD